MTLRAILSLLALTVPATATAQTFAPDRVKQAIDFAGMKAIVGALGHTIEGEDREKRTLRAADPAGTRYVLTGTACDIEGVPGCRGIVMQVLFEATDAVTLERLAAANLNQVAVSTRFDPQSNVVSVTRYVVLDKGVTLANIAENIGVLLLLAPEVVKIIFAANQDAISEK